MTHSPTVALTSIGCRTNQEEIASLASALQAGGYHLATNRADADIIIINTCSVTGGTEAKTKRLITSVARQYPRAQILVTGCLAQQLPDELMARAGVAWVVGNTYKRDIPAILEKQHVGIFHTPINGTRASLSLSAAHPVSGPLTESRTRFLLKIQEGCDYRCSYCIVPLLRGPSRSVGKSAVITACQRALDAGYREIVLTGTHIGQYAHKERYGLIELVDALCSLGGDFRLRLGSLDPRDCTEALLDRIREEPRLCEHVHISVQSLSHAVLHGMRRVFAEYDRFIFRMVAFRERTPLAGIGGDFIVGFPGETDDMFAETLQMVGHIGFNYGHVFRYSKRPGTVAAAMGNHVPEKVKTRRSDTLRSLLAAMRSQFIGNQCRIVDHTIIIEKEKPATGMTSNYIRVVVPGVRRKRNTWQRVRLHNYLSEKNCCEAVCCGEI